MRADGRARSRALLVCVLSGVAALLAGCAANSASTQTVSGGTLTVYVSIPSGAANSPTAQDVLAAEEMAFARAGGRANNFVLKLHVLHGGSVSDHARTAIQDTSAIAYVGEITPGQSAGSLGIVGDQGLLQVSPTDTAVALTQASPAVKGSPGVYYEQPISSGRTFARVVPTSTLEVKALLAGAGAQHVAKLFVADDGSDYGSALAAAAQQPGRLGLTVVRGAPTARAFAASGADGLLFATANPAAARTLFSAVAKPGVTLFAPSALNDQAFVASLPPAAQATIQISSPGFLPADLPPAGREFETAFTAAHHHAPAPEAIFGFEAMSALVGVLQEAHNGASNRNTVVKDFLAIKNRSSVLGTYSITATGDTTIAPFVISRARGGRLTPYKSFSEQG